MTRKALLAPSAASLASARGLAAAHPAAHLPCPACGVSLRADNLEKHLVKLHEAALRSAPSTTAAWSGADRRVLRPLIALTVVWVLGLAASLALLGDAHARWIAGAIAAGLFAGIGLMALAAFDRLRATLTIERGSLRLRHGFGLLRHTVRLPAAIEVGRLVRVRQDAAVHDAVYAETHEESAGSYLHLTRDGAALTVRCPENCALDRHWDPRSARPGPKRGRWDITLDRASFAALEYMLADRGMLSLRTG